MIKKNKEYKLSKFKWFEHVPVNWHEGKISYFFEIGRGRVISELELNPDALFPVYSSQTKNDGCLGFIDTYDFDDNILTWTTDGANAGTVFIRSGKFNCTNVCGTLKPKVNVDLKYYLYYLQTMTPFYKRPDTNGAKIMNNEMARIYCLIPPIQEQTKIAQYLDHQTAIIDQLILQKEKMIALLKEKRQAVINEAVTKGLNPNAIMKDSGIEWLGEVPEHWEVIKLRYLCKITTGSKDTENREDDGEYPFFVRSQTVEKISTYSYDGEAILTAGDGVGVCKVWHYIIGKFDFHQRVYMMHEFDGISGKYLFYYMRENFINDVLKLSAKSTVDSLRRPMFLDFKVLVPATFNEQKAIVKFIEEYDNRISGLIKKEELLIDKLKEYRQSLISEAVTGKIDLRDWQLSKNEEA